MARWALALALAGCGRLSFERVAPGDAGADAPDAIVPVTRHWVQRANHEPGKVHAPELAFDPSRGTVVLYGGDTALTFPGDPQPAMWELQPTGWSSICNPCTPGPKGSHTMAYDPDHARLLMFGGQTLAGNEAELWSFASGTWTQLVGSGTPSARHNATFVHDPTSHRMLLFGGETDGAIETADVFSLVDQTWSRLLPAGGPSRIATYGRSANWDPAAGRVLSLEGGELTADALWSYDGAWAPLCTGCTGRPRTDSTVVADLTTTYVIGGYDGVEIAETYTVTGDHLTLHSAMPPARDSVGAAYDPIRDVIVIYGGNGDGCVGGNNCDETWELVSD